MEVVLVGLSYKTAPVPILEKTSLPSDRYREVMVELLESTGLAEAVGLSTCNRSEFYAAARDPKAGIAKLADFVGRLSGVPRDELEPRLYKMQGREAVQHLMLVASSLDSMVLGENEIQSQVKDALLRASSSNAAGPVLQRLFNSALHAGKKVRTRTGLGRLTVSISSTAVELAGRAFGGLEGHSALVVGAGETAELALPHLKSGKVDPLYVASRTLARAEGLARKFDAVPIPFNRIGEALAGADIVLVATSAPHFVVHWPEMEEAMYHRRNRPVFIIDMSVPRNVDPVVGDINNVHLCNIDDLEVIAAVNRRRRSQAVGAATAIVGEYTGDFERWLRGLEVVPTLVSLRSRIEELKAGEEAKLLKKLDHLSEKDKQAVVKFGRSLVNKILHEPSTCLKDDQDPNVRTKLVESVRLLFGLESDCEEGDKSRGRGSGGAESKSGKDSDG